MAIISGEEKILGILTPSNFHNIYHLKPVEVKCNKEYLDIFYLAIPKPQEVMKPWYKDEEYFKDRVGITKYSPKMFVSPTQYLNAMLSRLHGEANYTNFKFEWFPVEHGVMLTGTVLNWVIILSQNLLKALEKVGDYFLLRNILTRCLMCFKFIS